MHPLPLVLRECYNAGRRPSTFRLRMAFGGGGMGVTIWAFLVWGSAQDNGAWIYKVSLMIAAIFALGAGWLGAGDSVSREKREGTLGFLFLTDLSSVDVILGKFAAAMLVPGCTLLALFPSLALCQLLGGVTVAEFWRGVFALALTLFFSLSVTLYASACTEDHRRAHAAAALLLVILNPLWICLFSFEAIYVRVPWLFWAAWPLTALLGVLFLGFAVKTVSATWRHSLEKTPERTGVPKEFSAACRPAGDPIAWVMSRRRKPHGPKARGAMLVFFLFVLWFLSSTSAAANLTLLFAMHFLWLAVILTQSAYSFYTDRQDGSLELLLGTELSVSEVFDGFYDFFVHQSRGVLVALSLLDIVSAAFIGLLGGGPWAVMPLAMGATLWVSLLGLGWVGVYHSLLSNYPWLALLSGFFRIPFFPLVISALLISVPGVGPLKAMLFWVITTGFTALFFALDARAALKKHGRELLLRPFSDKPPHIENDWSFIDWSEESAATPSS